MLPSVKSGFKVRHPELACLPDRQVSGSIIRCEGPEVKTYLYFSTFRPFDSATFYPVYNYIYVLLLLLNIAFEKTLNYEKPISDFKFYLVVKLLCK